MRSSSAACWSAANPKVNGERFGRTNRDLIRFRRRAPANGRYEKSTGNLTDAQIVTLCVAQVLMGIPSDRRFLRAARRQLGVELQQTFGGYHVQPGRLSQAARPFGRNDRVADRRLRRAEPWQQRRPAPVEFPRFRGTLRL